MSRTRHPAPPPGLRTFSITTRIAALLPPQSPGWAQLIYSTAGSLTVEAPLHDQLWFVPARRALWVPAGVPCRLRLRGTVRLHMIYLQQGLEAETPRAINVPPLLHECLLEATRRSVLPSDAPLTELLRELLRTAPLAPLVLPMPRDLRALRVARRLLAHPARATTLAAEGRLASAAVRTIERLFSTETGMSFNTWRQRLRMLRATEHLLAGDSVATTAEAVGYASVSAFVVAFKQTLGTTPARWIRG